MPAVKIFGPYPHREGWRCYLRVAAGPRVWAPTGRTRQEAELLAQSELADFQRVAGTTVADLISGYVDHLRAHDRSPATLTDARNKLLVLLQRHEDDELAAITPARARTIYSAAAAGYAAATHHEALKRARAAWTWAIKSGLARVNPWTDVQPTGRPRRGKLKLTIDETNRLLSACLIDVARVDGALAIAILILCGVRSSEVLKRQVRDVDANGTRLNIPHAKSEAGKRSPAIPEVIQAAVRIRTTGRASDAPLLRNAASIAPNSAWLAQCLSLYCKRAGVPKVCPHALRGGWADLAYSAGELSHRVAAALGHASSRTTERHYVREDVLEDARQAQRLSVLKGGKP